MFEQAESIEQHGPGAVGHVSALSEEAARQAYMARTGVDLKSKEGQAEIYAAIEAMGRKAMEEQAAAAARRRAAAAKSRGAKPTSGKV